MSTLQNTKAAEMTTVTGLDRLIADTVAGVDSPHTKRMYSTYLRRFLEWYQAAGWTELSRRTIQEYRQHLRDQELAPGTVNYQLAAVRKLVTEAAANGLIPWDVATAAKSVPLVKQSGVRPGNWLSKSQAEQLLHAPDTSTLAGKRDRAMLAVLVGAGLRRAEVARLTFEHLQQRDGRWVIVDIRGKGGRFRSVPIAPWAKAAIDRWRVAAGIDETGPVFRPVNKGDNLAGESVTPQAVYYVVEKYGRATGLNVAAHDLRRTFAKLGRAGGAALEQIRENLGHASVQTTERYLGTQLDLQNAPADLLGLTVRFDDEEE